ncbi:MAG: DNA-methyltransferase [Planctomycetota bacterium]|jgi:site-specific DNA-methyltransferase (adenine-specific)
MKKLLNWIICGDCIEVLGKVSEPFADLIFADPPFNIGYKYDKYNDNQKRESYISWTNQWIDACYRVLKPNGSFYIAIGDDYAADVKIIADRLKLEMRNWIVWHYTFGQQTKSKFARAHTHIFYFVKDKKDFTFNDYEVRFPSDRQLVYNDKRANPAGKMPDDVWSHFPRVCGTFKQRKGWHPCQMPESLLARIIRVSSEKGDWVLDPFSGSGTTAVVAAKLKRKYTGIELSSDYAKESRERIRKNKNLPIEGEGPKEWTEHMDLELKWLYHENNVPTGQLSVDEGKLALFTAKFNSIMANGENQFIPNEVMKRLIRLRKSGKLGPLREERVPSSRGHR